MSSNRESRLSDENPAYNPVQTNLFLNDELLVNTFEPTSSNIECILSSDQFHSRYHYHDYYLFTNYIIFYFHSFIHIHVHIHEFWAHPCRLILSEHQFYFFKPYLFAIEIFFASNHKCFLSLFSPRKTEQTLNEIISLDSEYLAWFWWKELFQEKFFPS